ncbi:hypothetical protein PV11_04097 [Exophiala sideris]|uniref:Uncharacterized protein n=1 Tax=Exophiala sideris TaxID=1016849 RepID=A0A0D1X2Y5_9EURO|nr:hypothetical protein PV11_04097 [Exophiala sideris]
MVFFLLFSTELGVSLSYHWGLDIYEACPTCVRAHELRTCDGETIVTFKLCDEHAATDEKTCDMTMLNEIRHLVYPLYSTVPNPKVSRKDLQKNIKITTIEPTRPRTRRSVNPEPEALPYPTIQYGHAKGCIKSDAPDVVIKSATAVKAMDDYAKIRLDNINALLDAGVEFVDVDAGLDFSKSRSSSSSSDRDIDLAAIFAQAAQQEATELMLAEKKRLEECLTTSSLTKGLYFKRCNGEYRNALDDVLGMHHHGERDLANTNGFMKEASSIGSVPECDPASASRAAVTATTDYGYALHPDTTTLPSIFPGKNATEGDAGDATEMSSTFFPQPETFKFTTDILKGREDMVRSGAVDDADLCCTCWTFHRQEKRAKGRD